VGVSGTSTPSWSTSVGGTVSDGTVTWLNQGAVSAVTPPVWTASYAYNEGSLIVDSNNNIEVAFSVTGTDLSGASAPVWSQVIGATTIDNNITWENVGTAATSALATAGGTSGIIIDDTLGSGILTGTSQIYFSTLNNQACGTTGTGGCAVQASQSALQWASDGVSLSFFPQYRDDQMIGAFVSNSRWIAQILETGSRPTCVGTWFICHSQLPCAIKPGTPVFTTALSLCLV
jgi:hypothetical protein